MGRQVKLIIGKKLVAKNLVCSIYLSLLNFLTLAERLGLDYELGNNGLSLGIRALKNLNLRQIRSLKLESEKIGH